MLAFPIRWSKNKRMTIYVHENDLPADLQWGDSVAVDTETMGLKLHRDRLCLLQISSGDGHAHLVRFDPQGQYHAPNLKKVLDDPDILKIFHYARFDVAAIALYLDVVCDHIYCTKIASKLCRTYTDRHGLRELCKSLLSIDLNKEQQSSDWGAVYLSDDQKQYAANDVLYLHEIKEKLDAMLARENRTHLAQACFGFIPYRVALDEIGFDDLDIFHH
jgi:ribonuclease D